MHNVKCNHNRETLAKFNDDYEKPLYLSGSITDEELAYIDIYDLLDYTVRGIYTKDWLISSTFHFGYGPTLEHYEKAKIMPTFGKKSRKQLDTCHEDLQTICNEVIISFDFSVIEGERDKATQNRLKLEGKSKILYPHSKHNHTPSMAVDIVPYPSQHESKMNMVMLAGWMLATTERLYKEGKISHKLIWGGDWNRNNDNTDQTFDDFWHFELIRVDW